MLFAACARLHFDRFQFSWGHSEKPGWDSMVITVFRKKVVAPGKLDVSSW